MARAKEIIADLRSRRNERNIAGMRRFGITPPASNSASR
jgi:hypothetical protein